MLQSSKAAFDSAEPELLSGWNESVEILLNTRWRFVDEPDTVTARQCSRSRERLRLAEFVFY